MAKYPESIDDLPAPPKRRGWWHRIGRHLPAFSVLVLTSMLATVVLWPYMIINVPSGQVGVLWKRFNGVDIYCWCWVGRGTVLDPRELREEEGIVVVGRVARRSCRQLRGKQIARLRVMVVLIANRKRVLGANLKVHARRDIGPRARIANRTRHPTHRAISRRIAGRIVNAVEVLSTVFRGNKE